MISSKNILRLVAAVAAVVAAGAFASLAAASPKPALAHAQQRAACQQRAAVHCTAHVVTDKRGRIVRFKTPPSRRPVQPMANVGSTAYAPSALHTGYQLPWNSTRQQTIALIVTLSTTRMRSTTSIATTPSGTSVLSYCSATVTTACFDQVNQNGYHSGYPANTPGRYNWTSRRRWTSRSRTRCASTARSSIQGNNTVVDSAIANNTAARLGATEISNSWGIQAYPGRRYELELPKRLQPSRDRHHRECGGRQLRCPLPG